MPAVGLPSSVMDRITPLAVAFTLGAAVGYAVRGGAGRVPPRAATTMVPPDPSSSSGRGAPATTVDAADATWPTAGASGRTYVWDADAGWVPLGDWMIGIKREIVHGQKPGKLHGGNSVLPSVDGFLP